MKYFIILLLLMTSSLSFAASSSSVATTQTITGGTYDIHKIGSSKIIPYTNQTNAKSAAGKLSKECLCKVGIIQPVLIISTEVVLTVSTVSFDRPKFRTDGTVLAAEEIKEYELHRLSGIEIIPASGETMTHITAPPQQGEVFTVLTVDNQGLKSDFLKIYPIH